MNGSAKASAGDANAEAAAAPSAAPAAPLAANAEPQVVLDTSNVKSTYCNVCNASATREEVVLNFGVNKNWDFGGPKLAVEVQHRVILNPRAAKRLHEVLGQLLKDFESRYGDRL
jgi:Protein of unknown function (DUF3467)